MRAYVRGQELNRSGKPREALVELEKAVKLDPKFGMAYVQMASSYTNLKMEDKAKANYEEAFKHLDRMTEREKYRSRGVYYFGVVRNYKEAIKTYEKLVELYPADNTGYANLALAHIYDRNIPKAIEMGRKAIEIYPRDILQRTNYATYSMYGGDFKTAVTEAQRVLKENPAYEWANLTLALSTLAQGDEPGARAAYTQLAGVSALGASLASMGQADLEMYYGRYGRALEILKEGIARDEKEKDSSSLGLKLVAAGGGAPRAREQGSRRGRGRARHPRQRPRGGAGPRRARADPAGQDGSRHGARARPGTEDSAAHPVLRARHQGRHPAARATHPSGDRRAAGRRDAARFLGRAHAARPGVSGRRRSIRRRWRNGSSCVKRRGEAADAFIADTSSMRYLPAAYYWLGRAQESLGVAAAAAESYRKYVEIRKDADGDPLVADARKRAVSR